VAITREERPLTAAQQQLVLDNLGELPRMLRYSWYRSYVRTLGMDEAYQVGCLAFCRTASGYEAGRQKKFTSYAGFWLRAYLATAVKQSSTMKDPRRLVSSRPGPRLVHSLGEEASALVRDPSGVTPDVRAAQKELARKVMDALPLRLQRVVLLHAEGHTLEEVGGMLGVTRQRASQLLAEARGRVRAVLSDPQ
jgi:RNA polymerase sigma factor (sigma-70 family)